MQQVADWLEKLGMSEYAQRFAENDIDFATLGDLSDQDLEKIGVASLAIAASCSRHSRTERREGFADERRPHFVVTRQGRLR